MRKMKDSGIEWIGEVPENWEVMKNKYILSSMYSGGTPGSNNADFYTEADDGVPFVSISDMSTTSYIYKTQKKLTLEGLADKNLKILPAGTILYSIYATIGAVSELKIAAAISQAMLALGLKDNVNKQYYKYCLSAMREYVFGAANGNTQFNLNAEKVWNYIFPIPSAQEQEKITNYLDKKCAEIDAIITAKEKTNELLKERRQSIIYEAVTKGLDPTVPMKDSGIEWIGEIPESSQIIRMKYLCKIFGRIGFRGYTQADLVVEGEGPITLSPSNISEHGMDYSKCTYLTWEKYDESPEIQIHNNDILLVKTGSSYGKSAIVADLPMEATINPQFVAIKEIVCNPKFLYYAMQTKIFEYQVEQAVVGGTIPTIAQEKINKFCIVLHSADECEKTVAYLDTMSTKFDALISANESTIEKLKEYRQSVIYEAVTGKVEI